MTDTSLLAGLCLAFAGLAPATLLADHHASDTDSAADNPASAQPADTTSLADGNFHEVDAATTPGTESIEGTGRIRTAPVADELANGTESIEGTGMRRTAPGDDAGNGIESIEGTGRMRTEPGTQGDTGIESIEGTGLMDAASPAPTTTAEDTIDD